MSDIKLENTLLGPIHTGPYFGFCFMNGPAISGCFSFARTKLYIRTHFRLLFQLCVWLKLLVSLSFTANYIFYHILTWIGFLLTILIILISACKFAMGTTIVVVGFTSASTDMHLLLPWEHRNTSKKAKTPTPTPTTNLFCARKKEKLYALRKLVPWLTKKCFLYDIRDLKHQDGRRGRRRLLEGRD